MAISKIIYKPSADGTPEVWMDVTDTTATAPDVMEEKYFYGADGVKTVGTGSGGVDGDELGYGNFEADSNLIGYGEIGSMVITSYGYGLAGYFTTYDHVFGIVDILEVEEEEEEEGENDGI